MIQADETFSDTWPFTARYFSGRGFKQHYVDESATNIAELDKPETFVLVHGEPTWGYIWRNFIPRLSAMGRVVVPDHMGFGKSETPQDRNYSAEEHCDNFAALMLDLDLKNITLVMQDWGGPIGSNFAFRHPERIKRVFYIDSITRLGSTMPAGIDPEELMAAGMTPWFEFFASDKFDAVMSNLGTSMLSVLKIIGFKNNSVITPDWINAYSAPFATPEECIGAKRFPLSIMEPETDAYLLEAMKAPGVIEALAEKPAVACIGEDDLGVPLALARETFYEVWPNRPFITLPNTGHFAQEDSPEMLVALIEQFVQLTR